jgi:hypothetical protein
MHRFGWLLIGFGALLLLTKGGAGFWLFPLLFFWPLALGFLCFGRAGRHGWHGAQRHYHWRGRSGSYGCDHGCAPRVQDSPEYADDERRERPQANTGETTRL